MRTKQQIQFEIAEVETQRQSIVMLQGVQGANVKELLEVNEKLLARIKQLNDECSNLDKKIPCHACQGGGCPVCNGFGYYYN